MKGYEKLIEISGFILFSDSQAALKALGGPRVMSELVAECLNAFYTGRTE
jgi:hypothetical protein